MTWADAVWFLVAGFWLGFAWRDWGYRSAARHETPQPQSNEGFLGVVVADSARRVLFGKKCAGPDIQVTDRIRFNLNSERFEIVLSHVGEATTAVPHETNQPRPAGERDGAAGAGS